MIMGIHLKEETKKFWEYDASDVVNKKRAWCV